MNSYQKQKQLKFHSLLNEKSMEITYAYQA